MDYEDYKAGQTLSNFWFRAKKYLVDMLVSQVTARGKSIRILNLGAGTGDDLEVLGKYGKVYVIDVNKKAIDLIPEGLCFQKRVGDACRLPYKDNFFDIIVAFDVFEHIKKDSNAVSEANRVLKKGCPMVFTLPAFQFLFSSHDKALMHYRRYSKKKIRDLMGDFRDLRMNYWNIFLFPALAAMRLIKRNSKPKTDYFRLPGFIDSLFCMLLRIEIFLIKHRIPLLPGLTITGTCFKR